MLRRDADARQFRPGRLLSTAISFDIAFDRLACAFGAAILSGLAASIAVIWWKAGRFTLTERIILSCAAIVLILFPSPLSMDCYDRRRFCSNQRR